MLGTVGFKLTRTVDSDLSWTGRRARTSFFNKNKAGLQSSKSSRNIINRNPLQVEDMPVSDSEKLGVSILGRHFRDTLDVVPIKKRKFTLVDSPPPSRGSPPLEDSAGFTRNPFLEQDMADGKASLQSGNADFIGISILATAACNGTKECLMSTPEFSAGPVVSDANGSNMIPDENLQKSSGSTSDNGDLNSGLQVEVQGLSLSMKNTEELQLEKDMPGRVNSSSVWSDRFHWDLNTVMDDWESPFLDGEKKAECGENSGLRTTELASINLLEKLEIESSIENQPSDSVACSQDIICNKVGGILRGDSSATAGSRAWFNQANGSINTDTLSASVERCLLDQAENESTAKEKAENHSVCVEEGADRCRNLGTMGKEQSLDKEPFSELKNSTSDLYNTSFYKENDNLTAETNPYNPISEEQDNKVPHLGTQDLPFQQPENISVVDLPEKVELIPSHESSETCVPQHSSDSERQPVSGSCSGHSQMLTGDLRPSVVASIKTGTDNDDTTNTKMELIGTQSPHRIKVGNLNRSAVMALEEPCDSDLFSDVSQNGEEVASVMKKVEGLETVHEEYQYEDGEFRVSASQFWGDVCDEGDAEQVDYDSDSEEMDFCDAPADCTAAILIHAQCAEAEAQATADDLSGLATSSKANYLGPQSCSTISAVKVVRKVPRAHAIKERSVKTGAKKMMNDDTVQDKICSQKDAQSGDGLPVNSKAKLSGWDQLSDVDKHETLCEENNGEIITSTISTQLPSHIEGPRPSETSLGKDKEYSHGNRSNDCLDESNSRFQKSCPNEITAGGGPSYHFHGRVRGIDSRMDSNRKQWGPRHGRSAGYFGPSDFRSSFPKNKAASAKVENSGFFVTPDDTIIKAGGFGTARRLGRQSENASSHGIRRSGSGTDGEVNFGMKMGFGARKERSPGSAICRGRGMSRGMVINTGYRERYNGHPSCENFDVHHPPNSSRDRTFSPFHRRPLRLSHSAAKSRSRSRSHSPQIWERRSIGGRDNGVGCFQRQSRSPSSNLEDRIGGRSPCWQHRTPNFGSEARTERGGSPPWRQPGFSENIGYVPTIRNNRSPPHASRWIDDGSDVLDRFSEQCYKRSSASERVSSGKMSSANGRFHVTGPPGRLKPEVYYRPISSGRYHEFAGPDRGPRGNDRRKQSDGYNMILSKRHRDIDGDIKQYRYDLQNEFGTQSTRSRSDPGFNGRGSSRGYNRQMERSRNGDYQR